VKKNKPYTRDWVQEAFAIARSNIDIKPKKEHILAMVNAFDALNSRTQTLVSLMNKVHKDKIDKHKAVLNGKRPANS